ncbi:MAG: hypothetical protein U0736_12605 [Gemmataceae bacterium]
MSGEPDGSDPHFPDEATPSEVPEQAIPEFGLHDRTWSEEQWRSLLETLVEAGVGTWKDITALVLGHLNPSQVGTSLASSEGFRRRYGKGNTMKLVMEWAYTQTGRCADCGTRLELQADHIAGRESFADPLDADYIENMTLRCRRCNVVRRPSHEFGGLTFLTAEAALMWILLVIRPRTLCDFIRMCRLYGMTMSDIRMQEAWAMAHWLARAEPPAYGIEDDAASSYDLLLWPDSAVTRTDVGQPVPQGATRVHAAVPGAAVFGFFTRLPDGRLKFHEQKVSFIPFSTYQLGGRPPQSLCIRYTPPDREAGTPQKIAYLPPRGADLVDHAVRSPRPGLPAGARERTGGARPWGGRTAARKAGVTKFPPARARLVAVPATPPSGTAQRPDGATERAGAGEHLRLPPPRSRSGRLFG